ncbi:hypothetical protein K443DRAFT_629284, partial [Laccaria amethystina LaAM-08-1]
DDLPGPFQDNFIRGSIFFFSQPAADLPIQPLVRLSNPKTPLISAPTTANFEEIRAVWVPTSE